MTKHTKGRSYFQATDAEALAKRIQKEFDKNPCYDQQRPAYDGYAKGGKVKMTSNFLRSRHKAEKFENLMASKKSKQL